MESGLKSAENNAHRTVTNVTFSNITATGGQAGSTQNEAAGGGCRVKSRPNSTGSVRDIRYEDMVFDGVYWPAKPPLVLPFRADYGPFSSWRGPRTALNCSYRGDRVTRAWPVGLRVRAAQTETRKGLNTKGYPSTYLAMGFANVRAGTQKRRGVFGYPPEH